MEKVPRTEQMEVGENKALGKLCHRTKNLYNRANYVIKHTWKEEGKLVGYNTLARELKTEECYKVLPAQTSQQTLKLLGRNWKSFFRALKEYRKEPKKFLGCPRPPAYKAKKGQTVAVFTNQQVNIRNGWIVFPRKANFKIQTRLSPQTDIREVRIIPRGVGYTVELVYKKTLKNKKRGKKLFH